MKAKLVPCFVLCLSFLVCTITARPLWADHDDHDREAAPLKLLGMIAIPGNPIASTDIANVDQETGRLYFSDRSNLAVEVVRCQTRIVSGAHYEDAAGTLFLPDLFTIDA